MKKTIFTMGLMLLFILTTATQCNEDDNPISCTQNLQNLQEYQAQIEAFAANSVCNDNFECRYIAFGSKPCGGPRGYLVYSTSIDTLELEVLVSDYNEKEESYNLDCGTVSDCTIPPSPIGFDCENNVCIPIY